MFSEWFITYLPRYLLFPEKLLRIFFSLGYYDLTFCCCLQQNYSLNSWRFFAKTNFLFLIPIETNNITYLKKKFNVFSTSNLCIINVLILENILFMVVLIFIISCNQNKMTKLILSLFNNLHIILQ